MVSDDAHFTVFVIVVVVVVVSDLGGRATNNHQPAGFSLSFKRFESKTKQKSKYNKKYETVTRNGNQVRSFVRSVDCATQQEITLDLMNVGARQKKSKRMKSYKIREYILC